MGYQRSSNNGSIWGMILVLLGLVLIILALAYANKLAWEHKKNHDMVHFEEVQNMKIGSTYDDSPNKKLKWAIKFQNEWNTWYCTFDEEGKDVIVKIDNQTKRILQIERR